MDLKLNNKNALVCGSTAGIGRATAMLLAAEGARVTLIARNEDKLKAVLAVLPGQRNHDYIVADFSNPNDVKSKVSDYISKNRGFHILVNNTGGPKAGAILTANLDEFESAFTQHLKCNHVLSQAVIPYMKEEGYGRIINMISTSVKQPIEGLGVSNTIRGAVANWSKTLASEVGPFGITVNNVLPGATSTGRLTDILHNVAKKINGSYEEAETMMKNVSPAKRFAKPEEIANAVVFLASEGAGYINGINLHKPTLTLPQGGKH
mgnify:CR=1 FL=1